jgi:guanyl-specific ribonuclease Sa
MGEMLRFADDAAKAAQKTSKTTVPSKATDTLSTVRKTGKAPTGYKGGRTFKNDGRGGGQVLPKTDSSGNSITYKEYDVNPYQKGKNRGAERLVIGSDGNGYYTNDHYDTFTLIE